MQRQQCEAKESISTAFKLAPNSRHAYLYTQCYNRA